MHYIKDNRIAVISKPFYCFSTHKGLRVTCIQVLVDGYVAFTGPTPDICRRWLLLQGYWPRRLGR